MLTGRSLRAGSLRRSGPEFAAAALVTLPLLVAMTVASTQMSESLAFVAPAALVLCLFLVFNPRVEISLAILALYLGLLDGYLKLSTGAPLATSARSLLLYSIVAGALLRLAIRDRSVALPKYTAHVLLLVGVVAAQALHPDTPGVRAALGGMRQHIEFVPLLFFGYAVMRSERRLKAFFMLLVAVVVANSIVALAQYNMSPEALAAWGPGYAQRVLGTEGFQGAGRIFSDMGGIPRVRPFGLGSDSGVSGVLGAIGVGGALALIAGRSGRRSIVVGAVGVVGCALGVIASQSRSAVIVGAVSVVAFAALSVTSREATRVLVTMLVGGVLIYAGVSAFAGNNRDSGSRLDTLRTGSLQETIRLSRGNSVSLVPGYAVDHPLGVGLGRAGPASGFGGAGSGLNSENEPNFLIGELGTVGLVLFASLWLRILFDGIRAVRRTSIGAVRLYLAALVAPLGAMTMTWFASSPTAAPPTAPYFWFVAGIIAWAVSPAGQGFRQQPVGT